MSAEQHVVGDKKGVLHIPRWMILGNIQRFEIVVVILDIWPAGDLESHTPKDIDDLIHHKRQRVNSSALPTRPGKGHIDPLVFERLGSRLLFDLPETLFDLFLEPFSQAIELLAGPRALLRRQIFQAPQHRSQSTATTQSLNANLFDLRLGVATMNSLQHPSLESF